MRERANIDISPDIVTVASHNAPRHVHTDGPSVGSARSDQAPTPLKIEKPPAELIVRNTPQFH